MRDILKKFLKKTSELDNFLFYFILFFYENDLFIN
jgi:hypothetical protein